MKREVTAFAPSSVSNVACGFDIMGFALRAPGDTITARPAPSPGVRIRKITGAGCSIPTDPALNTAGRPILAFLEHLGTRQGVEIDIHKGMPVGSGIGSSAASAVAAIVACDALLETGLSHEAMLGYAIEGERLASGGLHVDNLSPSLWGGFILVRGYRPIDVVRIPLHNPVWCAIAIPHIEIHTKASRLLLPKAVPLADVVAQTGNAAGLVAGLILGDWGLISRSLQDAIAEPVRKDAIPGFDAMKSAALDAGTLGCSISGSGPSVFALAQTEETAHRARAAMSAVLASLGQAHSTFVSPVDESGARIIA